MTIQDIQNDQSKNLNTIKSSSKVFQEGSIFYKKINNRKRIFLSAILEKKIIRKIHEYHGHISANHIANKLRSHYYFPNGYCNSRLLYELFYMYKNKMPNTRNQ